MLARRFGPTRAVCLWQNGMALSGPVCVPSQVIFVTGMPVEGARLDAPRTPKYQSRSPRGLSGNMRQRRGVLPDTVQYRVPPAMEAFADCAILSID